MHITSIRETLSCVQTAGDMALEMQRSSVLRRDLKDDGSIVTQADTEVEEFLIAELSARYPQVNILSEETARAFDPAKDHTFVLDPVDGTDVFSLGMPGWCLALALLDRDLQPIAGIIYAPRWDLFLFADVGAGPMLNGQPLTVPSPRLPLGDGTNLMVTSRVHRYFDLRRFPGKIRSIGSAALHLSFPVVYADILAAIQMPTTYIWDIAAAHAICLSAGYRFEYFDGRAVDYAPMVSGGHAEDVILAGPEPALQVLRETLTRT